MSTISNSDVIEKWLPVVGFEGKYEISDFGRVKSLNYRGNSGFPQILKLRMDKKNHNYMGVSLVGYKSTVFSTSVHRLVMHAFIGGSTGRFIDHIDGDGSNNNLSNLRYCSHRENLTFDNVRFKKPKSSKYPGVSYNANSNGTKKWRAIIAHKKVKYNVGTFATQEEAREAYLNKLKQLEND